MSYNFINEASTIRTSTLCYYDTVDGFKSNFSINGEVDGWEYWDGIHTYGCWGGFLFGTLYGSYALLGRTVVFYPVPAETHYFVKITMKINPVEREGVQVIPTTARVQWTTTSDSSWDITKSYDFTIIADNEWHTYILNMGELEYWQGDINNLRLYPILEHGVSGDEFFIKVIKISSIDTFTCKNPECSYYASYSHPCQGVGTKGYCKSAAVSQSTFTIEENLNDEIIININDYGNEVVQIDPIENATGAELAKSIATAVSRVGIGGYAEVEVNYTDYNEFLIYSGTYTEDSSVIVIDNALSRELKFFDSSGDDLSTKDIGSTPATGFDPGSSFKIKSFQLLTLFDNNDDTYFSFDPSLYNIEGGNSNWLSSGMGVSNVKIGANSDTGAANVAQRSYSLINNANKTVIDFNHPFNASGRIKKINAMCTLDQGYETDDPNIPPATDYQGRISATGCKVMIFRPKIDGSLEVIHTLDIPDRDYSGNRLYSYTQETIDIDCDVWVNKGDLLGIYNANVYVGRSISGEQVDALYYQINGEPSGEFDPGEMYGEGLSGLLIYARSDKTQDKLVIDVDLGSRININNIEIEGTTENSFIDYNIARCLDVNWTVNLFGGTHSTGYTYLGNNPEYIGQTITLWHENVAYGINKLNDGIYIVKDGYAGDGYSTGSSSPTNDGKIVSTFVPTNPQYFFVNGDQEWLGVYELKRSSTVSRPIVSDFNGDPIAFTLLFPYGMDKTIYKSAIYFKERWNFRNFALSVTYDLNAVNGNADDVRFNYIPEYTAVTIDGNRIEEYGRGYDSVSDYLFVNPCHGEPTFEYSGVHGPSGGWLGEIANFDEYTQASNLDWSYLAHEFEPITCKGFRFYCNYHYSTKITEMELYCKTDDIGSNLSGGMGISYSYDENLWWQTTLNQESGTLVVADVEDTPQYFTIEIEPITKINMQGIRFNTKNDELFVGEKGCEYQVLPVASKTNATNAGKKIEIKNIYNSEYDLYVDIADDKDIENRLVYFSKLDSEESITNPDVGPDGIYSKTSDYPLLGVYKNCAINCDCWGLKNLIDGKKAYYSYDNGYTWFAYGTLASGISIDFSNITEGNYSVINLPLLSRNRYWKIGWLAEDHPTFKIRELIPFYAESEITNVTYYYHDDLAFEEGALTNTAAYLRDSDLTGTYADLIETAKIGLDIKAQKSIKQFIIYHDAVSDYDATYCGIDKYTKLNLTAKDFEIIDYSYDEKSVTVNNAEADTGKWDFDFNQVPTVSGLCLYPDSTPTSSTLGDAPEMVDGVFWVTKVSTACKSSNTNHSHGIDLGEPKKIHRLRFYINAYPGGTPSGSFFSNYNWYIYKSNDNITWELAHKATSNPTLNFVSTYEAWFDLYLPVGTTARYFKIWYAGNYTLAGNNNYFDCNEIEAYVDTPNSYKTGLGFKGSYDSYVSVPASNDLVFPGKTSYFTLDFHVNFDGLPVPSGLEYCTLLRNWPDEIESSLHGTITYPPTIDEESWRVESPSEAAPDANYAITVEVSYNLAKHVGASYSKSSSSWGNASSPFDGRLDYYNSALVFNSKPCWSQVTLPEAKTVTKFGVCSYHPTTSSYVIKDFELQAYVTTSGTWLPLHSVTNYATGNSRITYYSFTNPYEACTDYRLYITANYGSGATYLNEFLLFDDSEGVTPTSYIMKFWIQDRNPAGDPTGYYWHSISYNGLEEDGHYHVAITRGIHRDIGYTYLLVNGEDIAYFYGGRNDMSSHSEDLIVGEGLKGSISDLRITKGIERTDYLPKNWHVNERYYTLSLYVSEDNLAYGKYCDLDLYQENSYSYYFDSNIFASNYYSRLAIDFGTRHNIDFIRDYGESDAENFDIDGYNRANIHYSNEETDDIYSINWSDVGDYENSKTIYAAETYDYSPYPDPAIALRNNFTPVDCSEMSVEEGVFAIDLRIYGSYNKIDLYRNGGIKINSDGNTGNEQAYYILDKTLLGRIDTSYRTFYFPLKYFETNTLDLSHINHIEVFWYSENSNYSAAVYWKNAEFIWNMSDALEATNDARWVRFDLLNGDSTDRIIRKLGIYPDISTQQAPGGGHYNHEWSYLGKAITSYESSTDLALGASVSGSDYFGVMNFTYITDGIMSSSTESDSHEETTDFYNVWGSNEANPWFVIDLAEVYSIYRVKVYHGYNGEDTKYMITDYDIAVSTDDVTYTTIFTITGNSSFERTHDLEDSVQARYVKIIVNDYNTQKIILRVSNDPADVAFFEGALLREVEVYEYYGYSIIDSEEYPIMAINMADQFYVSTHSIIGIYEENSDGDWLNNNCYFCYSDSIFDNPSKVKFKEWNVAPGYDQWAAIKMTGATDYNGEPSYLKHARIISSDYQNPCAYPWWWQANLSTLSRDYSYELDTSTSALKIEYPASSLPEHIAFIEGDHFSVDALASWRDGFSFRFRIDDVDNLDRSYGYFYLGGKDASSGQKPVTYKWNIATLSGSLSTGWNNLFLRFKEADEVEYTYSDETDEDTRVVRTIDLGSMGLIYKGIGNALTLHLDGFKIERNRFYDYSAHGVGAYLNNNDYVTAPLGEYDLSRGTIEFWMRPDYTYNAVDYYGTMENRAIFSFNNNANDVFGLIVDYNGFEIYYGNTHQTLAIASLTNFGLDMLDVLFHVGIVFSNDGSNIDTDGSTIRLYLNNKLVFKTTDTWEVYDNKQFKFILGGSGPLNLKASTYIDTSSINAVLSYFKIYNYCKTDFYNSIRNIPDGADKLVKPSNFIELSKDNLTYYKVRGNGLPLVYENVAPNNSVPVYVRTNLPDGLTGKEIRTAGLKIFWDIAV